VRKEQTERFQQVLDGIHKGNTGIDDTL
jgi:hypothetical protein